MTRRSRRVLFYCLVLLFILLGTGVISYAEGWRIDFTTWHLVKVGEVFVRPYPADATITLDKKTVTNQNGIFSHGTLIPDVLPGSHELALSKEGYLPWREEAFVETSFVAQFKYAVLIPRQNSLAALGPISDFGFLNTNSMIVTNSQGSIVFNSSTVATGKIFFAQPDKINPWPAILFKNTKGSYLVYNSVQDSLTNLTSLALRNGLDLGAMTTVTESRFGQDPLLIADNSSTIWIVDETASSVQVHSKISAGRQINEPIALAPGGIAWTVYTAAKNISSFDFYNTSLETISTSSTNIPGKTISMAWIQAGEFGVLQDNGSLYSYDANANTVAKIADNVRNFSASKDGVMVAAAERESFEAFDRNTQDYYRFNLPDAGNIQKLIWYKDDSHLFVVYPDHVAFLDLTDRNLENFTTFAEGTDPVYDPNANSLYLIEPQGNIVRFDFPN